MDNPEILKTLGTQGMGRRLEKTEGTIKNGQSRDTGNIGYTRHRIKIKQNKNTQHRNQKEDRHDPTKNRG